MNYKNNIKRRSNTHVLEVSCAHCKTPIALYQKAGRGNLIKMQLPCIIECEVDLSTTGGALYCPNCHEIIANKGIYRENIAFWIIRGKINTKKLAHYKY